MVFGRKKKSYVVSLSFERYDFPHLVGMQYANDVDFKINPAEYYGEKLITAILSGRLDPKRIEIEELGSYTKTIAGACKFTGYAGKWFFILSVFQSKSAEIQ